MNAAAGVDLDAWARRLADERIDTIRFAWCDLHGVTHCKSLSADESLRAMQAGVGMVSTLLLKDTSDRTAWKVFERGGLDGVPGFGQLGSAANLLLFADPASFRVLPWSPGTAWVQGQLHRADRTPVELDTRRILVLALERLARAGYALDCGLEVEFHIYRIDDASPSLDPEQAAWPGLPPKVSMIHPGYSLLGEAWADLADEPLRIVRHTAAALGLRLASLEIELGPSQVEAVFEPCDALEAADAMVRFRNLVRQTLRRAGYHASFMCRPPFPNVMASGWHLHHSLRLLRDDSNAFRRDAPAAGTGRSDAAQLLSPIGDAWLAGLLAHAPASAALCTPTTNGYARLRPNALAPTAIVWGRDNRGAMLRVIGETGDASTRIENRLGEPAANPYLYVAAQVYAGLDGIARGLVSPRASDSPYDPAGARLPSTLADALDALRDDGVLREGLGDGVVAWFDRIKRSEIARRAAAEDPLDFDRREYFSRI
ncbi:MAG: glutamine synthetase family protein [Lautropia sp.]